MHGQQNNKKKNCVVLLVDTSVSEKDRVSKFKVEPRPYRQRYKVPPKL